ncbi:MAG: translation initiation factor IF-2 [Planctomycetota bacterium]|nr:MAG: translation initiation factor IF-2 [Planctomycetota bacterium]
MRLGHRHQDARAVRARGSGPAARAAAFRSGRRRRVQRSGFERRRDSDPGLAAVGLARPPHQNLRPQATQPPNVQKKKRLHDLAKEYGLKGEELVAKLNKLGYSQFKNQMATLSEFDELEIRGKLEAYGIVGASAPSEAKADAIGGLVVKRKKKPVKLDAEAPAAPEPAPVAEAPSAPSAAPVAHAPTAHAPAAHAPIEAPEPELAPAPEPVADPAPVHEPRVVEARSHEPRVESAPAAATQAPEPIHEPAPAHAPEPPPEPAPVAGTSPEPIAAAASAVRPVEPQVEIVRPGAKRRPGNVVGFVDLSKMQPSGIKRPEARRLRSSDEGPAPNVQPTLGVNKKHGLTRGDAARGQLTQQQLRERESSRFLRKRGAPPPGPGSGQRRFSHSRESASASPTIGGALSVAAPLTIKKLADAMSIKLPDVLKAAIKNIGFGVNINSLLDDETAVLLAAEFQIELSVTHEEAAEAALVRGLDETRAGVAQEDLETRPPCVAILGHVDHGKTTLIDTIRKTQIAADESGGITQHIGAYQVTTQKGHKLTIVDTPGHAAFTAMRARGARAVDIVVLVVAADDGVMPQTTEALEHARAAKVPIVVAINKIDKPGAKPDQVKNQLASANLIPEEWGGTTAMLPVSGLKGDGVQELLERVFLESEVLDLRAHATGAARGVVLEAEVQQGKGRVAHLLIQDGCLKRGDIILAGEGYGKVKSIHGDRGEDLEEAGPSMPVEVTGLNELPGVGSHFHVVDSIDQAREVAEERARTNRQLSLAERRTISQENILQAVKDQDKKIINVIVKGDVQGSVEVLKQQISTLVHPEVELKLLLSGVGQVSESDVNLAITSQALVIAFHVSTNGKARTEAERSGIEIRYYEVIYELLDELKAMMEGSLSPEVREEIMGHAEVRRVFPSSKFGNIAGCMVLDGTIARDHKLRIVRDGRVIQTTSVASLRREKDDAKEVREGFECGVTIRDFNDAQVGDVLESYKLVESKRLLKI